MTIAIVLSGGGNRGPLEIGALQALLEHGIRPDFVVGTSAGALNASFLAAYGPEVSSIPRLAAAWRSASVKTVYPQNVLGAAWRVLRGADSLFSSDGLRRLVAGNMPPGVITFGQLKCPCYTTAADLRSGRLYLFGEDPSAPLVDAVVASASMPAIHPPIRYRDLELVDGGIVASVPVSVAMERGATTIYAVNVGRGDESLPPVRGVLNVLSRTLDTFFVQPMLHDLDRATADPAIDLHHIQITAFGDVAFNDFSRVDAMIAAGKAAAEAYLANPQPRAVGPRGEPATRGRTVPGAREFIP
jgi:NTE family protein